MIDKLERKERIMIRRMCTLLKLYLSLNGAFSISFTIALFTALFNIHYLLYLRK